MPSPQRLSSWSHRAVTVGALLTLAACTLANVGPHAAANQTQQVVYRAAYDVVYRAAVQQAGESRWDVLYTDHAAGALRLAYPQTLGHWGDTVAVNLTPTDSGTVVLVRSHFGQSENRTVVRRYLVALGLRLGSPLPPEDR